MGKQAVPNPSSLKRTKSKSHGTYRCARKPNSPKCPNK